MCVCGDVDACKHKPRDAVIQVVATTTDAAVGVTRCIAAADDSARSRTHTEMAAIQMATLSNGKCMENHQKPNYFLGTLASNPYANSYVSKGIKMFVCMYVFCSTQKNSVVMWRYLLIDYYVRTSHLPQDV